MGLFKNVKSTGLIQVRSDSSNNLAQKVGDKFTKVSEIDLSMECSRADFLQFSTKKLQNLAVGWTVANSP